MQSDFCRISVSYIWIRRNENIFWNFEFWSIIRRISNRTQKKCFRFDPLATLVQISNLDYSAKAKPNQASGANFMSIYLNYF